MYRLDRCILERSKQFERLGERIRGNSAGIRSAGLATATLVGGFFFAGLRPTESMLQEPVQVGGGAARSCMSASHWASTAIWRPVGSGNRPHVDPQRDTFAVAVDPTAARLNRWRAMWCRQRRSRSKVCSKINRKRALIFDSQRRI